METYIPVIKTYLSDWFQLTLDNPLYAAALAMTVWLLTAIVYSIKVASLKKKITTSDKARIEMQNNLYTAQQKVQYMQGELASNTEQMQKDKELAQNEAQRAAGLEEQLSQRNKQIAAIIQSLATNFDLGEHPLSITEDIKAEGLWQQHDRFITLLSTRLRSEQQAKTELQQTYQAETLKRAEKEALIETLQTTLVTQTSQVAKLEQALAEQKSMLQQQLDSAKQALSFALEKHQFDLAHLDELKQQAFELVHTRQQLRQLEEKLNARDARIALLEKNKPADQVKVQPQAALVKQEVNETIIELKKAEEEVPPASLVIEQQPVSPVNDQSGGVTGKIRNLFGKTKQETITAEPEPIESKQIEEIQPLSSSVEQQPVGPAKEQFVKFKKLFGSTKQQHEDKKRDEEKIQPLPSDTKQPPISAAKGQLGKLKNLFATKQQPSETKQDKDGHATPSNEEQQSLNPEKEHVDESAGKTKNIPDQLKIFYRKFTSKTD